MDKLRDGGRGVAVDHHLDIVEGVVADAIGIDAGGVVGRMVGGIPPASTEIKAAAERQFVVDDHQLLMMAGPQGHQVIEADVDLGRRLPAQRDARQRFTLKGVKGGVVPEQEIDAELRVDLDQPGQQCAQAGRFVIRGAVRRQVGPAVDIPPQDVYGTLRPQQSLAEGGEIGCRVDQNLDAVAAGDPPAGSTGVENESAVGEGAVGPSVHQVEEIPGLINGG